MRCFECGHTLNKVSNPKWNYYELICLKCDIIHEVRITKNNGSI